MLLFLDIGFAVSFQGFHILIDFLINNRSWVAEDRIGSPSKGTNVKFWREDGSALYIWRLKIIQVSLLFIYWDSVCFIRRFKVQGFFEKTWNQLSEGYVCLWLRILLRALFLVHAIYGFLGELGKATEIQLGRLVISKDIFHIPKTVE